MTREDSINKMKDNMYHENAGKLLKDLSRTLGKEKTDSLLNAFFDE
jgi:hypothetical protein